MARRKLENRLVNLTDINEELKPIENSNVDYITPSGKIYCYYGNNKYLPKTNTKNKYNGYLYVSLKHKDGYQFQRRVHILVEKAYIKNENPQLYNIVMHIDNDKTNNNVNNLKWGTISQNTKQAFDDGLLKNDKGFNDSQSKPVCMFDYTGKLVDVYGSISIAAKTLNINKLTISYNAINNCKKPIEINNKKYFFRFLKNYLNNGFVL